MGMYQVEISRIGVPAQTLTHVAYALQDALGEVPPFEAVHLEHGIWLVELPADLAASLEADGYLEVTGGDATVRAEMP